METIRQILADNIRIHRKVRGFSQEKLGELCGSERTYIGGVEQQTINASIGKIENIATALHVDPAILFIRSSDDLIEASKKRGKSAKQAIEETGFKPDGIAICSWQDDAITMEPLDVQDSDLAVQILIFLVDNNATRNLARNVKRIHDYMFDVVRESKDDTARSDANDAS